MLITQLGRKGMRTPFVIAPEPSGSGADILFFDDFSTGNYSKTMNGVHWTNLPYMDVVDNIIDGSGKLARFRQGDAGQESEARFEGIPNVSEVFLHYKLYWPDGNESPSVGVRTVVPEYFYDGGAGNPGRNNKFFRLWATEDYGYTTGRFRVGASTWTPEPDNSTFQDLGYVPSNLMIDFGYSAPPAAIWPLGPGPYFWGLPGEGPAGLGVGALQFDNFIGNPVYMGRWVDVKLHVRCATEANDDGVIKVFIDDVFVAGSDHYPNYPAGIASDIDGWPTGSAIQNYISSGYILGAGNTGFVSGTYTYMKDFTIATGSFPVEPPTYTPVILAAHNFADGTSGSFGSYASEGQSVVTGSTGYSGSAFVSRHMPSGANLSGQAYNTWVHTEDQTRDGNILNIAWAQRFPSGTIASAYESGSQIKMHIARSDAHTSASGEFAWDMTGIGWKMYGSGIEPYIGINQDYGNSFLASTGLTLKSVSIVPDTWYVVQVQYRKYTPTFGTIAAWVNGVEVGKASIGCGTDFDGLFGSVDEPTKSHLHRFGLGFYERMTGTSPMQTDVGKIVCSTGRRLTINEFDLQGNV